METKKSRGRPASKNPLGRQLAVRFTADEEALVRRAAGEAPLARWLREVAVHEARAVLGESD
jgi:hypothetical protein